MKCFHLKLIIHPNQVVDLPLTPLLQCKVNLLHMGAGSQDIMHILIFIIHRVHTILQINAHIIIIMLIFIDALASLIWSLV